MVTIPADPPPGTARTVVPAATTPAISHLTSNPTVILVVLLNEIVEAEPTKVPSKLDTVSLNEVAPVVAIPIVWSALPSIIPILISFAHVPGFREATVTPVTGF